jgi:glycosyltransferase involved in cell wall biosynthesis
MNNIKRILYVHYGDNWLRGSEVVLLDLLKGLDRSKFEPIVWTNCSPLAKKCNQLGIQNTVSEFHMVGGWNVPRWDVSGWNTLIKQGINLIEEHAIDLVHVNSGGPCQWMCWAARMAEIPLVTQLHCHYTLRDRFSLGLHLSPKLICVSENVSLQLLEDGYPQQQMRVVHNGVSLTQKSLSKDVKRDLGIPASAFTFLSVGSLIQRKGFDRLIHAMRLHNYHQQNPHLVIVGDGEEREHLERLSKSLGVDERIHFVGEQDNVAEWLTGNVDAFISGAYEEAFGLALGEAALAELPIIAPMVGGIPELFKHNHNALLYQSSGMASLLNAIQQMMTDASLRERLSLNARNHAENNLSVATSVQAIESIYLEELKACVPTRIPLSRGVKPITRWLNLN